MARLIRCPNKTDCGYYTIHGVAVQNIPQYYERGPKKGQPKTEKRGGKKVPVTKRREAVYAIHPRGMFDHLHLSNDIGMEVGHTTSSATILICPCCGVLFNEINQSEPFNYVYPESWKKKEEEKIDRIVENSGY